MKPKKFSPFLAPNETVNLDNIKYPILASYKLDGIRCIFYKGEMLSRSLKPIQNKQLREKFKPLIDYSREHNIILDGEIYSPELTFQAITKFVMTKDFTDQKTIKKHGKVLTIPEHLKYYAFDTVGKSDGAFEVGFNQRLLNLTPDMGNFKEIVTVVKHEYLSSKEEVEQYFETALEEGYEGLILREPNGRYKCGRGTLKEGLIYKLKKFIDFDGKIIDVIQSTEANVDAEKTINELNRSVTSKKKGDRHFIEKASAFLVQYEGNQLKVVIAMSDKEKKEVWYNKKYYIGKWITYKGMLIGAKNVVRHPVFLRFGDAKD